MTKVTTLTPKPLDERIATVITSDDHRPASALAELIRETDEQIDHCDQLGREMRARSTDPAILDPAARGAAEDSEFRAARLRNGLARLRELHHEAEMRERLKAWHEAADDLTVKRDALAAEFKTRYPAIASWLPDVLQRMAEMDRAIEALNASAPGYESRRLLPTELVARNADGWGVSKPVAKTLRLPQFSGLEPLLWPIPQQFGVGLVAGLFPRNGSVESPTRGVQRFELIDGVIRAIGANGAILESVLVEQPVVEPLHPEMSLREQALAEEAERAAVAARHADDARAREVERQRSNDRRHNKEFLRQQQSISR
jgi:hypothetical protein